MSKIEEEMHVEPQNGEFDFFEQALECLKEFAKLLRNEKPNKCPCSDWKSCESQYQIIEYFDANIPWKEISKLNVIPVSAKVIK